MREGRLPDVMPRENSVRTPCIVMRPIRSRAASVNHIAPSGPSVTREPAVRTNPATKLRYLAAHCDSADAIALRFDEPDVTVWSARYVDRCAAGSHSAKLRQSSVSIDSSQPILDAARETMAINGLDKVDAEYVAADVFDQLRVYREKGRSFDVIILDPPKFAHSMHDIERAARGYKDINLLAFQLLRPGGLLLTFSCSGLVNSDLFQKIVFAASIDADRPAQIIGHLGQGADHPVLLTFPEGQYLKGLICRVLRDEDKGQRP